MAAPKGHKKQGGRKKGVPNKNTGKLRDMILNALDKAGGEKYLATQAKKNPGPFMQLLGKVLPKQLTDGDGNSMAQITKIEYVVKRQSVDDD